MTREEVIDFGEKFLEINTDPKYHIMYEFVESVLKLLKQDSCEDCISRQSVKEGMIKYGFLSPDMTVTEFVEDVLQQVALTRIRDGESCKMSAEEYRQRMMQAFRNAGADELIGVCVLPKEEEFKLLEGMLKDRYNREHNDDLVSKQYVIKAVDSHTFETDDGLCLDDDISCILEDLPPSSTQEWIPCSERLPEIHNRTEKYLVTLEHGGTYVALFTECDGKHWWSYDDVVAWMPLPLSYQGE